MFEDLKAFMMRFGSGSMLGVSAVLFGSLINALLEMVGVMLIFPLMALVLHPEQALKSAILRRVDEILFNPKPEILILLVSFAIASIYILKAIFQVCFMLLEHRVLNRWRANISYNFFQRVLESDYHYHLQRNSSGLIAMINEEIRFVMSNYVHNIILFISNAMVSFMLVAFLAYKYTLVTFVVSLLFSILFLFQTKLIGRHVQDIGSKTVLAQTRVIQALNQGVASYKETKINLRERFFCNIFYGVNHELIHQDGRMTFFRNLPLATTEVIVIVTMIIGFDLLLFQGSDQASVTIDLGVMVMTVFRMVPLVNRGITSITLIRTAVEPVKKLLKEADLIGYEKVVPLDQIPDETTCQPLKLEREIVLRDLCYTYPNANQPALMDVSLTIKRGDFIGIIGSSGAGKTTLIGVMLGFLTPEKGEYRLDDTRITEDNLRSLRRAIGYVDQQTFFFDATIMENVAFGQDREDIDRARVQEALQQAELWSFVQSLELGMDSLVGESAKLLSGGQRQRLAIARALYKRADILILDEATSALDVETEFRISSTIRNLRGKLTIIAIAHRLSTLKACDRLVLMQGGRIVNEAPYNQLLAENEEFQKMVNMSRLDD